MLSRTEVGMLLPQGQRKARVDCPQCGGKKTLSISVDGGDLKWYCFRNSCDEKGLIEGQKSPQELRLRTRVTQTAPTWQIPEHFASPFQTVECVKFLRRWDLLDALSAKLYDAKYDPQRNRLVFLTQDGLGGTGRTLYPAGNSLAQPKWLRYGDTDAVFCMAKGSDTCIVTEDVLSCIRCSEVSDALALQGTRLQTQHVVKLRRYKKVLFALDPDAKNTALAMTKVMIGHTDASVLYLRDDPKCLSKNEIMSMLDM